MLLSITPTGYKLQRELLLKKSSKILSTFLLSLLLPVIAILGVKTFSHPIKYETKDYIALVLTEQADGTVQGSATLVSTADNMASTYRLITAKHLVEGKKIGESVSINFTSLNEGNGLECTAKIVWLSPTHISPKNPISFSEDVAVLELEDPELLPANFFGIPIGESEALKTEDKATAYGYRQFERTPEISVADCTISNLEPIVNNIKCSSLLRVEGDLKKGLSGGPLIFYSDRERKQNPTIVGINVATYVDDNKGYSLVLKIKQAEQLMLKYNSFTINQ